MINWKDPATDARLRKLWTAGLTGTEITHALGSTRNAVLGKVHRLGLPARSDGRPRTAKPDTPRRSITLPSIGGRT